MKLTLPLLAALLLSPLAAQAGPTQIAQLPLLNVTGTGLVKPNLMLLYDNSASMGFGYSPDYVNLGTSCRKYAVMSAGVTSCQSGHPPYHSPDFNKQYYNPTIHYETPVRADGSRYMSMTRANTGAWTNVTTDGFGVNLRDVRGAAETSSNLVTGFADKKWCTSLTSGVCGFNSATYTYPNDTYKEAVEFNTNAYYYTINTAEFCSDANLTNCSTTAVGAPAPAGYPYPAKVRFCNSTALTNCQGRYVGAYIYPRYANPNGGLVASYGTITIGPSNTATSLNIDSVSVTETSSTVVITNGTVNAPNGTNTAAKQAAMANAVAASIVAKTGLVNQYTACVRTSSLSTVPNCASFGITLGADNIVAVVPIDCSSAATSKALGQCSVLVDNTRSGWAVSAIAPVTIISTASNPTALLTVTGTTHQNNTPVLASMSLGSLSLFGSPGLSLGKGVGGSSVAAAIRAKIATVGTVTAYLGNDPAAGSACAGQANNVVCLVDTAAPSGGAVINMGNLTNNTGANNKGTIVFTTTAASPRTVDASDRIPVTGAPLSSGNAVFVRTDIIPARTAYPRAEKRNDCASGAFCTYDEEMTNFANWYAYYKTRNQMMKSAVGRAFDPVTASFKVGIVSLSTAAAEGAMTPPRVFSGTNRADWYNSLYAMNGSNSTPLRQALNAVGKMYANRAPYVKAAGTEVVQYPCEQNFTFMTTDGYWNGDAAAGVESNDEVETTNRYCSFASGCVDTRDQTVNSLADVSLYWYNGGFNSYTAGANSLRPSLEDWSKPGLVAGATGDNRRLHMTTYTLGLGVDGIMTYDPKYNKSPAAGTDFYNLTNRVMTGCPWNGGGPYVWPDPVTTDNSTNPYQSRVDDLWHAAVNGHGKYFSAADPAQVIDGLRDALSSIESTVGAAAAAATSTPNISQEDNDIFSDTFTTVKWYGELSDKKIDTVTGEVINTPVWLSSDQVGRKVSASADTRVLKMLDIGSGALKNFKYSEMSALEKSWFDNKCADLPQCPALTTANKAILDSGENIVNWLRGQQQYANDEIMRSYALTDHNPPGLSGPIPIVLGDIASSKPAFLREPRKQYTLAGYNAFVLANQSRMGTVFAAANDGMLHAFRASTGEELWGYAPRITMKKLFQQTSTRYGTNHQYTTDGSPELADVQIGGVWKTVLVAGLNGGGRGYYALDVTDPANPLALWELCADPTVCSGTNLDADLGLSFGNPQFGMYNGQWVVLLTSGYNNIPGGDNVPGGSGGGFLFIVDPSNGRILQKIATGSGDTATPSGFAKISAITTDPQTDPVITHVYGGDNQGQMWRFDLTNPVATKTRMGDAGVNQPITTRPEVTTCKVSTIVGSTVNTEAKKVIVFGTGRLLDIPDVSNVSVQSIYMLKDSAAEVTPWKANMVQQTLTLLAGGSSVNSYKISSNDVDLSTKSGWYVNLDKNPGERVNLDPMVVAGSVTVVANMPSSSNACSVGGSANVYQLDVCTGSFINSGSAERIGNDVVAGHTLSATSAAVGFIMIRLPTGILKMVTTTADGRTITGNGPPTSTHGTTKSGWRQVK